MGSSLRAIYDDYDSYEILCKTLGVPEKEIKAIRDDVSFYKHAEELLVDERFQDKVAKIKDSYLYNKFI